MDKLRKIYPQRQFVMSRFEECLTISMRTAMNWRR